MWQKVIQTMLNSPPFYSDVSRDVAPGSRGVVYSFGVGKNKTWLDVSYLIYCQRNGFVERIPLSCCVINCTNRFTISSGIIFFRYPESVPKRTAWINQFVEGISPSARESVLFTSCQSCQRVQS